MYWVLLMKRTLSTTEVAKILGVSVGSVKNWVDKGHLKAGRTPGGHRHVSADNLVVFLDRQGLPIPPELERAAPKVLIVDSDPVLRQWTAQIIGQARPTLDILEAGDGYAAGVLAVKQRPAVVFLDLRMPGLDGCDVCRRIKADEDTRGAAVIALAGDQDEDVRQSILENGARSCLTKPVPVDVLLGALDEALDGAGS